MQAELIEKYPTRETLEMDYAVFSENIINFTIWRALLCPEDRELVDELERKKLH